MKHVSFNGKPIYPSKIVCIGRNYAEHIEELNNEIPTEPVIFIKPNSALSSELKINQKEPIHYEAELCFLIHSGKIAGVGIGLDLTKREVQTALKSKGLPWERAKAFDNSAVFSDFVNTPEHLNNLSMQLYINGNLIQHGTYELMLNKPNELLAEANTFLTFEDGDVLMTGTPKGVGIVNKGDEFVGKIMDNDNILVECRWMAKI